VGEWGRPAPNIKARQQVGAIQFVFLWDLVCASVDCLAVFRVARVGGNMNNGTNDGLWYWNLNNDSSNTNWNIGARLLICIFSLHTIFHSTC